MIDFVPERICRACWAVMTAGRPCVYCERIEDGYRFEELFSQSAPSYTISALRWFTDHRGKRRYY